MIKMSKTTDLINIHMKLKYFNKLYSNPCTMLGLYGQCPGDYRVCPVIKDEDIDCKKEGEKKLHHKIKYI